MNREQVREAVGKALGEYASYAIDVVRVGNWNGCLSFREKTHELTDAIMKLDKPPTVTRKMLQEWWILANDSGLAGQTWVADTAAILTAAGVNVEE